MLFTYASELRLLIIILSSKWAMFLVGVKLMTLNDYMTVILPVCCLRSSHYHVLSLLVKWRSDLLLEKLPILLILDRRNSFGRGRMLYGACLRFAADEQVLQDLIRLHVLLCFQVRRRNRMTISWRDKLI